jgi:hypothetical protein
MTVKPVATGSTKKSNDKAVLYMATFDFCGSFSFVNFEEHEEKDLLNMYRLWAIFSAFSGRAPGPAEAGLMHCHAHALSKDLRKEELGR